MIGKAAVDKTTEGRDQNDDDGTYAKEPNEQCGKDWNPNVAPREMLTASHVEDGSGDESDDGRTKAKKDAGDNWVVFEGAEKHSQEDDE